MTLENLKERLLNKIATEIEKESFEGGAHYFAQVYSTLCHADTQDKMTDAAIHGGLPNPFGGIDD